MSDYKNYMAEVAGLFGVELGEVFKITDDDSGKYHNYYRFTEKKGIEVSEDNVKWEADTAELLVLKWLLIGVARIIKLPWKPRKGEKYYVPRIAARPENRHSYYYWGNSGFDIERYKMGIVCRTKEEAISLTEKMLVAINEQ
ncbi:MAG: hypothetical protein MR553_04945 [Veillonellaceae bacterium]|nr:hypothetical protein [Veillonellaceae bacterium]